MHSGKGRGAHPADRHNRRAAGHGKVQAHQGEPGRAHGRGQVYALRHDSDDTLLPDAVSELVAAAEGAAASGAHGGRIPARFVPYADVEAIAEDGSRLSEPYPSPSGPPTDVQRGAMMLDAPYGLSASSLIHGSALDGVGMFDERYGAGEDVELNLRPAMPRGAAYCACRGRCTGAGGSAVGIEAARRAECGHCIWGGQGGGSWQRIGRASCRPRGRRSQGLAIVPSEQLLVVADLVQDDEFGGPVDAVH